MKKVAVAMDERYFIDEALGDTGRAWAGESLESLSRLRVPDRLLGKRRMLLRADINEQWARWFVESLVDPRGYLFGELSYAKIFSDVYEEVDQKFEGFSKREKRDFASVISNIVIEFAERGRASRRRRVVAQAERHLLLELAGNPPRCWICGMRFAQEAVENFLYQETREIPTPRFMDVFIPRGLSRHDFSIEVDHIVAHACGGGEGDNLALSCGWCNRYKSSWSSVYDVEGQPRVAGQNSLGFVSLPHPFWSVRLLATVRCCEYPGGCERSADSDAMTVALVNERGAPNPVNLRVSCFEHDPLAAQRFQPERVVREMWKR